MQINLEEVSCIHKVFIALEPKHKTKKAYVIVEDETPSFVTRKLFVLAYLKHNLGLHIVDSSELADYYNEFVNWVNSGYLPTKQTDENSDMMLDAHGMAKDWGEGVNATDLDVHCFFLFLVMENFSLFKVMKNAMDTLKELATNGTAYDFPDKIAKMLENKEALGEANLKLVSLFFKEHPNNYHKLLMRNAEQHFDRQVKVHLTAEIPFYNEEDAMGYKMEGGFVLTHLQEVYNILCYLDKTVEDTECTCSSCSNKALLKDTLYMYINGSMESLHANIFAHSMIALKERYTADYISKLSFNQCTNELEYLNRKINYPVVERNSEGYVNYLKHLHDVIFEHRDKLDHFLTHAQTNS
jgi:hypothetical protein